MLRRFSLSSLLLTAAAGVGVWAMVAAGCLTVGSTGGIAWPTDPFTFSARWSIVASASVVGAALGAAGCAFQAVLRNALADPYLLGVSSGASLASYLWRFQTLSAALAAAIGATLSLQAFTFAGAIAAVAIVLALSTRRGRLDPLSLLLVGVSVNAIVAAIYLLLISIFSTLPGSGDATSFLVGGLQTNVSPGQLKAAAVIVVVGVIVLMSLAGGLNVATLGESEAQGARHAHSSPALARVDRRESHDRRRRRDQRADRFRRIDLPARRAVDRRYGSSTPPADQRRGRGGVGDDRGRDDSLSLGHRATRHKPPRRRRHRSDGRAVLPLASKTEGSVNLKLRTDGSRLLSSRFAFSC